MHGSSWHSKSILLLGFGVYPLSAAELELHRKTLERSFLQTPMLHARSVLRHSSMLSICTLPCRDPFLSFSNLHITAVDSRFFSFFVSFFLLSLLRRSHLLRCFQPRILHGRVEQTPKTTKNEEDCMDRACRPRPRSLASSRTFCFWCSGLLAFSPVFLACLLLVF